LALRTYGILCFGLCRFRDSASTVAQNPSAKRYVITNPPDDFVLMTSDKVTTAPHCCSLFRLRQHLLPPPQFRKRSLPLLHHLTPSDTLPVLEPRPPTIRGHGPSKGCYNRQHLKSNFSCASRRQLENLRCRTIIFRPRDSAPELTPGANSAPPNPLAGGKGTPSPLSALRCLLPHPIFMAPQFRFLKICLVAADAIHDVIRNCRFM